MLLSISPLVYVTHYFISICLSKGKAMIEQGGTIMQQTTDLERFSFAHETSTTGNPKSQGIGKLHTGMRGVLLTSLLITIGALSFFGYTRLSAHAVANGQIMTPPMGWSSWNAHFANINASVIDAAADAVVSSGMKTAGYQYV